MLQLLFWDNLSSRKQLYTTLSLETVQRRQLTVLLSSLCVYSGTCIKHCEGEISSHICVLAPLDKPAPPSVDILVNLHPYRCWISYQLLLFSASIYVGLSAAAAHRSFYLDHRLIRMLTQWLKCDCRAAGHKMGEDPPTVCGIVPPPSAALCTDVMLWMCCCLLAVFSGRFGSWTLLRWWTRSCSMLPGECKANNWWEHWRKTFQHAPPHSACISFITFQG